MKKAKKQQQKKGHTVRGSRRLKPELIRPDAYRLKDNNDDVLSEHLEQLCHFFLFLSFSLTIIH